MIFLFLIYWSLMIETDSQLKNEWYMQSKFHVVFILNNSIKINQKHTFFLKWHYHYRNSNKKKLINFPHKQNYHICKRNMNESSISLFQKKSDKKMWRVLLICSEKKDFFSSNYSPLKNMVSDRNKNNLTFKWATLMFSVDKSHS